MVAKVQTLKFENALRGRSFLLCAVYCFVMGVVHYPAIYSSTVLLHSPLTISPVCDKGILKKIHHGMKDICIHYYFSCIMLLGSRIDIFVLSKKDKSKKHSYILEAVSPFSTAVFQQKLVQSLTFLCTDLSVVVYNSRWRFLISATGINYLSRT